MGEVTVKVPAEYAERFRAEAEWAVESAADNLTEALKWRRGKRDPQSKIDEKRTIDPNRLAEERSRLQEAYRLLDQAKDGELTVEADEETIASAMRGCLMHAGEDAWGQSQDLDIAPLHALTDELKFWVALVERFPGERARQLKREAA